jgi:hypothetical protein
VLGGSLRSDEEEARNWYVRALQVQHFPERPLVSPSDQAEAKERRQEMDGEPGGWGSPAPSESKMESESKKGPLDKRAPSIEERAPSFRHESEAFEWEM